jgi:hypothetical protein
MKRRRANTRCTRPGFAWGKSRRFGQRDWLWSARLDCQHAWRVSFSVRPRTNRGSIGTSSVNHNNKIPFCRYAKGAFHDSTDSDLFDAVGVVLDLGGIAHTSAQLSAGLVEKSFRVLYHNSMSGASRNFKYVCTESGVVVSFCP